jgi:thioredoxin reductase (NADPH)
MHRNVVIIGSGPAGYTAALYAARADLRPLMFSGLQPGGQLTITTDVENYPGFPDGIMGPEMMDLFKRQVERFGTEIRLENVTKVDFSQRPFRVWVEDEMVEAEAVIIATGASAKWLGLESEVTFGGYGVSACATCDGFFFRNKVVAVVGGGDTAMEEAHFLTKYASRVHLLHRRTEFRASKIMQDRVLGNPKVQLHTNVIIEDILGELEPVKKVVGVRLKNTVEDNTYELPLDGIFIAIGHKPNSDLFRGVLDMDESGYLKTVPGSSKTNIPGVFACGDIQDSIYRQAITAAGSGCMAAIDAERFLSGGHG